jgi:hypothetical protein
MKREGPQVFTGFSWVRSLFLLGCLVGGLFGATADDSPPLIAPPISTQTGLLLEPPLDLSWFSREDFEAVCATVGTNRIHKSWTNPITPLPPHTRAGVHGLTEPEVIDYMRQVQRLFDEGKSVPISDVGLISTQEDVNRRPMFNHIAAFSNATVRVYLLVQRTSREKDWGYYSIVQDLTVEPPLDYFAELQESRIKFEGISCYKCHSSGPLAIHPVRSDLLSDPPLAAALSQFIANQPRSRMHFPDHEHPPEYGPPTTLRFCSRCHKAEGDRGPLFRVQSHPIRVLVDFGYMPPNRALKPDEIAELKAWLEQKN